MCKKLGHAIKKRGGDACRARNKKGGGCVPRARNKKNIATSHDGAILANIMKKNRNNNITEAKQKY